MLTNPQSHGGVLLLVKLGTADLVTFIEEILNGKLNFLCKGALQKTLLFRSLSVIVQN